MVWWYVSGSGAYNSIINHPAQLAETCLQARAIMRYITNANGRLTPTPSSQVPHSGLTGCCQAGMALPGTVTASPDQPHLL